VWLFDWGEGAFCFSFVGNLLFIFFYLVFGLLFLVCGIVALWGCLGLSEEISTHQDATKLQPPPAAAK